MTPRALASHLQVCTCFFLVCFCGRALASDADTAAHRTASEYRQFTDKRGQQVEARIVSISDDLRLLNMEGRSGQIFELPITALSLDDQQFLRQWLHPSPSAGGAVKIFGNLTGGNPIHVDALEGVADLVSIHAHKHGWLALRESGDVMSFGDRYAELELTEVAHLSVNTDWIYITYRDGSVDWITGRRHSQEQLSGVIQGAGGNGHSAALLRDGSVKVWGRDYRPQRPLDPTDPPQPLSGIVQLASNQDRIAALHKNGRVFSWTSGSEQMFETMIGDRKNEGEGEGEGENGNHAVVELDGSIFHFIVLTRAGDVYSWNGADGGKAAKPDVLEGEGPFQKVRCNGSTFAAQKKDGSWIAWGRNHAGIVDHINSLGPVSELDFFSVPGKQDVGYVIWRE